MVDVANSEFFYSNVSSITTDFNVSPYYDDFDDDKNYYKLLFKPGFAVQARELTQIQSMLQDQIQKFGQHVFKEGSMVLGGKFDINYRANFIKVNDKDLLNNDVNIESFKGQIVTGQTTGVKAYVNLVLDGTEGTSKPKTLYVTYTDANPDTDEVVFTANEPLVSNVGTLIVANTEPVGYATVFTINEGVRFCKQHFIHHDKQSIVIDRYDVNPNCKVGFVLTEEIVNSSQDSSLLDPALESSNFSAPGADRFKITPILTRLDYDDPATSPDFVTLFLIKDNAVTEVAERPEYNVLQDELAKRTYDESGDYYVKGFNIVVEEHLDDGNNSGYLTSSRGGDAGLLSVQIEPGTCYVKGYEINKLSTNFLAIEKSTAFSNVNGQIISTDLGSYVIVNEAVGAWNVNSGQQIDLYDQPQKRISNCASSVASQTGKKIGTARVKSVSYDSGTLGTPSGNLRIHLFDVQMLGSNAFTSVKNLYYNNSTLADPGADVVLVSGKASIKEPFSPLLYYTGNQFTKTLRSSDGSVDTSFTFKKTSDVSIVSSGTFTLSSPVATEFFPYGSGVMSTADRRDVFLTLNDSFNIAIPGVAAAGAGSNTLTGSSTFFTRLNVGDKIEISGNSKTYLITAISNNISLTVNANLPPVLSGNSFFKAYKSGDMIDMTAKGADAGTERSITTATNSLTFDLKETLGGIRSGTVTYTMSRSSAREIKKILRPDRYVKIQCSTAGTTGPFNLGISDVYRIKGIWTKESAFATEDPTTESGVKRATYLFTHDKGQRDDYCGHAQIIPAGVTLTSSSWILVKLDYFEPDYTLGVGYFSVDSYPTNDVNPASNEIKTTEIPFYSSSTLGYTADLRNHIDFRPVYTNTALNSTTIAGASTNPAIASSIQYESSGLRLPADSEQMTYDYSYYLPRIDVVAVDKRGQFSIISGTPAVTAITPKCPDELMSLGKIYVTPFPSISINAGKQTGRGDLACSVRRTAQVRFTMRDIGVLKQRVDNIENYVSLSLLEKSAVDMKIIDENGLDRFKNGIFVDSFTSFVTADITNPDHHICYDPKEGSIRPLYETMAIGYDYISGTNITKNGNILMLPYTEVVAASQPYATTFRNVETTVYKFSGKLYLDPSTDYWVNTNRLASQTVRFGAKDEDVTPYSIVYGATETTVTGVSTTDPILIGSVSSTATSSVTETNKVDAKVTRVDLAGRSSIDSLIQQYGGDVQTTSIGRITGINFYNGALKDAMSAIQGYYAIEGSFLGGLGVNDIDSYIDKVFPEAIISQGAGTQKVTTHTDTTTITDTFQTTTSTTSQASRAYTETFQNLKTDTQSLGDRVTSVAPIADIRPQTIAFEARGLKANTRHYVFFDGQLMSDYVTPGTMLTLPNSYGANTNKELISVTGSEGSTLRSNKNGIVYGFLRLPAGEIKTFRTGTKEVVLTDSPTNQPDATSSAIGYFVAQGIDQTLQETIMSVSYVVTSSKNGVEKDPLKTAVNTNTYDKSESFQGTRVEQSTVDAKVTIDLSNISCMAYSFKLTSKYGDEGVFLSSVDVFFAEKDPNLGVWFEIRAMDNSGNITQTQVPGSEVWLESSQVNISDNGSVATNVKFDSPVFLMDNVEYAFVIHTVGINPNYYMLVSVLGQNDLITNQSVTARPLTGSLFTTNNNTNWDIVPRTDLKVNFYRAKFNTNVTGEAIIGNQTREFISLPDPIRSGSNTSWFGEKLIGNDVLILSTPTGGFSVSVGDKIVGTNSAVTANVISISGSDVKVELNGYQVGEPVTFRRSNGYAIPAVTSSVVSKNTAEGYIYTSKIKLFTSNTTELVITDSNGLFATNDTLFGVLSGATSNVGVIKDYVYSSLQFEPRYLNFLTTTCSFEMSKVTTSVVEEDYQPVFISNEVYFNSEYAILSRTREISSLNGLRSNKVKITMSSVSDYLSPIFSLDKSYTVYIHNLINSNTSGELSTSGGGLKNKYVSQVITLADGQDAEDLRVILTSYRPPSSNCDFKVYARISNAEDFESIYQRNWIELEAFDNTKYSSLVNRKDFREYQFKFPGANMIGTNDQGDSIIGYTNSVNTTFEGFRQYQIKIGLQSDNSAIIPRVADLRCIALQK